MNTTDIRNSDNSSSSGLRNHISLRTGPSNLRENPAAEIPLLLQTGLWRFRKNALWGVFRAQASRGLNCFRFEFRGDTNNVLTRRALAFFAPAIVFRHYPLPAIYAFEVYHGLTSSLEA